MITKINTLGLEGINPIKIETEVDISSGFPRFEIIGLPDSSIREAKHRVKTAIQNSGVKLQSKRIIINLSPAEIRKVGSHYDLSIAIGILKSSNILKEKRDISKIAFIGELSLDGNLKRTKGILPLCLEAKKSGIETIIVPYENLDVISIIDNTEILGAKNLNEVIKYLYSKIELERKDINIEEIISKDEEPYPDFSEVKGQQEAKRALEIAVAGNHNCMIIGPPGNGKTMLAKRILSIMPKLTYKEILEINQISSLLENQEKIKTNRPFINPHYSITKTGLIGGGNIPKPGAITLAHNGILFLDELLEFDKNTLESLRNPIEDKKVIITRNNNKVVYPCNTLLILATNPCKCGYRGSNIKNCKCSNSERKQYISKLSGPIIDRIDMTIECSNFEYNDLNSQETRSESSKEIRKRIERARTIQLERYKEDDIKTNSELEERNLKKYCKINEATEEIIKQTFKKFNLSIRSYLKILKIARTIADLEESKDIKKEHIIEAIKYKTNIYKYIEGV